MIHLHIPYFYNPIFIYAFIVFAIGFAIYFIITDPKNQPLRSKQYTAWQLLFSFWRSEHAYFAYSLFSVAILMTLALVGMEVVFNYWYNEFYNSLQAYDRQGATSLLLVFMFLASVFIVISVYRYYVTQYFGLRWRKWLTDQFMNRWLEKRAYYYLENFDTNTDNPDQRIQEDAGALVNITLELLVGLIGAITTFFAFILILWNLSGTIHVSWGILGEHHIHGYLVWVSVIYSLIGTYIAFKIGRPLIALNFEQQRREATFRFSAIDLRTHSEDVALYRGEANERGILGNLFNRVLENYYALILRQKLLLWFTSGYGQMSVFVPLLVVLPNYFSKVFLLGGLMQSLRAFSSVQDSLSFFVSSYTTIAQWKAVLKRLLTFLNHMDEVEKKAEAQNTLQFERKSGSDLVLNNLALQTPSGQPLLTGMNQTFKQGSHYLLKGPSGIGKSTLIRAIAGIWPFGTGDISLPQQEIMYLPQKPYVPIGNLREALMFPTKLQLSDDEIKKTLVLCHLPLLAEQLDEDARWSERLSPGELQRINFARVLLHKPAWIFLDESTSSLDLGNEKYLYDLLKQQLPNCTIVSVGHRESVEAFHDEILDLGKYQLAV